jgi:hypothetical protein
MRGIGLVIENVIKNAVFVHRTLHWFRALAASLCHCEALNQFFIGVCQKLDQAAR